jgi:hypothetical protein
MLLIEHYHKLGEKFASPVAGAAALPTSRKPGNFLSQNPALLPLRLGPLQPRMVLSSWSTKARHSFS